MNDRKWEYIRDMFAFVCITVAFTAFLHYCTYCAAGKVPL